MATPTALRFAPFPFAGALAPVVTFDDAVVELQDEVFGVALRITGDREVAADVTSATFLKAYRAFHRYDPGRPLRNWLLTIAVRESITAGRAATRERARREPPAAVEGLAGPAAHEPEGRAVEREERERIRRAVAALPELYRVPVVLRYFNDLSLDEIATVIGRPAATVGVQLLRARALLRETLDRSST
jgi:RNA polymerase sigma-70 factor (ECF subfamily)